MSGFRISTHGRLHDWIAVEKGYFEDEGLDYELDVKAQENSAQDVPADQPGDVRTGAYELYRSGGGGKKHMSCACHWAVNQAATDSAGRMWGQAYSILPSGIYVLPESEVRRPEDLAGVEVAVGYHSGSHFSTIQALEPFMQPDEISLRFGGMPYDRVDALLAGEVPAAAVWTGAAYLLEQQGARKIVDSTFMAGFMFDADTDIEDVSKYFAAVKRAQMDLDLTPERYKRYYTKEIPERFHDLIDVRAFGPGERVVFLPYTASAYEQSQRWMRDRGLFEPSESPHDFASAVVV
jgi:ABC-type nitrate/sulfonate/bicarbonate transport system substrate-binding protein